LVLHWIDPVQGVWRFYGLMIERALFGTIRLVRNCGRIGTNGQELVEVFATEIETGGTQGHGPGRPAMRLSGPVKLPPLTVQGAAGRVCFAERRGAVRSVEE